MLEKLKNGNGNLDGIPRSLTSIRVFINTAYIDLSTVIPELYAKTLQDELLTFGMDVQISYVQDQEKKI